MLHQGNEVIRSVLFERRDELMDRFNNAILGQPLNVNWIDEPYVDPDDATSIAILHLMEELLEVDAAIARIREGDYGTCRRCGQTIDAGRLERLPLTQFCQRCSEVIDE